MINKSFAKLDRQKMKTVAAAAIILMSCTVVMAATPNDVPKTDPVSNLKTNGWAYFLPADSLSLMPARKISLSFEGTPVPAESSPQAALKKQEIAYPTVYSAPRASHATFENAVFNVNLAYMTALNMADYFTTREALKHEELVEANPIMRPFVRNDFAFAAVKAGLMAGTFLLLKGLYRKNKPMAWVASLVANIALSYVVVNNLRMIDSAQQPGSRGR